MKRVQLAILDDRPVKSGIPKLNDLSFLNSKYDTSWKSSEEQVLINQEDALGFRIRTVSVQELESSPPEAWENTIFIVDVNWNEIAPDTPGFEDLSDDQLQHYGVVIAEQIFDIRERFHADSIHVIFFSNSKADLVDEQVRSWQAAGVPNVSALFLGRDQFSNSRLLALVWEAYLKILGALVVDAKSELVERIHHAVNRALKFHGEHAEAGLDISDLIGDLKNDEIKGYRAVDLAWPFTKIRSYYNPRHCSKLDILNDWLRFFDSRQVKIPVISEKNEASVVLQGLLRYGQHGLQWHSAAEEPGSRASGGLTFADVFLLGQNYSGTSKLISPSRALETWDKVGGGLGTQRGDSSWRFREAFQRVFSNKLIPEFNKWMGEREDLDDLFAVEHPKKGWNEHAAIRIQTIQSEPTPVWQLQCDSSAPVRIVSTQFRAGEVAAAFHEGRADLPQVVDAWRADPEHLALLHIIACSLPAVVPDLLGGESREELARLFDEWSRRIERIMADSEAAFLKLEECLATGPEFPQVLKTLKAELEDAVFPRFEQWRRVAGDFRAAAKQLGHEQTSTLDALRRLMKRDNREQEEKGSA